MPDLSRILSAKAPLTLSSLPRGAQPLVLADLARAAKQRAVFIAPDDAAMRSVAEAARFFAPEIEVLEFPAWDCLPYDRASPALSVSAARLSALFRIQRPSSSSQLVVTTANAVLQRVLTPFRVRESVREFKIGTTIGHDSLAALLTRQGYSRTDTVIDHGEFAVRGSIVDIFPSSLDEGLRLDFFGDELESLRLFDPSTHRSTGRLQDHLLLPASEALIDDESIKRFRSRYREMFGANATQDPLYEAVSDGRRLAGMEHWLPLFEDKLATLFDHLGKDDVVVIDSGAVGAAEERLTDITDYHDQRERIASEKSGSYRPLAKDALYLDEQEYKAHSTNEIFARIESDIANDNKYKIRTKCMVFTNEHIAERTMQLYLLCNVSFKKYHILHFTAQLRNIKQCEQLQILSRYFEFLTYVKSKILFGIIINFRKNTFKFKNQIYYITLDAF